VQSAPARDPRQLAVGLLGAGYIARVHASAWRRLGARVIVHSREGAAALAARHDFAVANTLDELLDAVDLVDIATPTDTHRELALSAIAAGRHVVCEKPLALSEADADDIADAARVAGVRLFPAHVARFTAPYATARRAVARGRIGNVAVARFARTVEAPNSSWLHEPSRSGGVILDLMVHDLDQARWMLGEVESVYAVQSRPDAGTAAVSAHATLTHTSGAVSFVRATWGAPGTAFTTSFSVAGDRGVLSWDSRSDSELSVNLPSAGARPSTHENPYLTELRAFAAAILEGSDPPVDARDGVAAVAIADAARRSVITGAPVQLAQHADERIAS
jgi:predicted dehydrogenase